MAIDPREFTAAAYHEAGHAVVAAAMGYDVRSCFTDEHGSGAMESSYPVEEIETLEGRRRQLVVAAAGQVAEVIGLGLDDLNDDSRLDANAREAVEKLAWLLAIGEDRTDDQAWVEGRMRREVRAARNQARRLLEADWRDVEIIAESIAQVPDD